jgi:steroid 5-alpha reductase family enzyme
MLQEFFPILEGAPMGDLWILLALGSLFMICWMLILWVWQWKRQVSGMENAGWSSGLGVVVLLYAIKADGYGPRRFLIAVLAALSSVFLARRFWVTGEPTAPSGFKGLFLFEIRAIQAVFLSLPMALLVIDPLPTITVYEWIGLLIWVLGMAGQIFMEERRSFYEWLVWLSYFIAALTTPYGGWTILCPLLMLVVLRPFKHAATEEVPTDIA